MRLRSRSLGILLKSALTHELEKIKAYILEQTEGMAENAKIELLDALAWWASEEAGSLNFESPDAEDYE